MCLRPVLRDMNLAFEERLSLFAQFFSRGKREKGGFLRHYRDLSALLCPSLHYGRSA